jgi:hypothetical protein
VRLAAARVLRALGLREGSPRRLGLDAVLRTRVLDGQVRALQAVFDNTRHDDTMRYAAIRYDRTRGSFFILSDFANSWAISAT